MSDSDELLRAAASGDENAFRAVYRDLNPRLLRLLGGLVQHDAEDVASEVWLHIARDLGTFHGGRVEFHRWAATIARHRAVDHLRQVARTPTTLLTDGVWDDLAAGTPGYHDIEAAALDRLSTQRAIAQIAALPRDQAQAVLLRVVFGLSAKRTGKVLGKSTGAVRTATYRGLRTLAERLDPAERGAVPNLAKHRVPDRPGGRPVVVPAPRPAPPGEHAVRLATLGAGRADRRHR